MAKLVKSLNGLRLEKYCVNVILIVSFFLVIVRNQNDPQKKKNLTVLPPNGEGGWVFVFTKRQSVWNWIAKQKTQLRRGQ